MKSIVTRQPWYRLLRPWKYACTRFLQDFLSTDMHCTPIFGLSESERRRDYDALIRLVFIFQCSRSHKQVAPKGYFF